MVYGEITLQNAQNIAMIQRSVSSCVIGDGLGHFADCVHAFSLFIMILSLPFGSK